MIKKKTDHKQEKSAVSTRMGNLTVDQIPRKQFNGHCREPMPVTLPEELTNRRKLREICTSGRGEYEA